MDSITALLVDAATSPWALLVVFGVCVIDGFFPPVPSETVVVATVAAAMASGVAPWWIVAVLACAAVGATVGDVTAYAIGRRMGLQRWRWMRTARFQRAARAVSNRVQRSTATVILVARFIPVGRVVVNVTAGAAGIPERRFVPLTILGGVSWAAICLGISGLASLVGHPLIASGIAIAVMLCLGLVIDVIVRRRAQRRSSGVCASGGAGHGGEGVGAGTEAPERSEPLPRQGLTLIGR